MLQSPSIFMSECVMTIRKKSCWLMRLENYGHAISLLREAVDIMDARPLTQLEKEGVIRRFKISWECAWKLLKEYLETNGIILQAITPTSTIRAACAAKILQEDDAWMNALDARKKISRTYNFKIFEKIITDIRTYYFARLEELYVLMVELAVLEKGRDSFKWRN